MSITRRAACLRVAAAIVLAIASAVACAPAAPRPEQVDARAMLMRGEAYVRALPELDSAALRDADVIAAAYLERARLGLGSPFRIIDYALRDPGLDLDTRERLAYGILALTLDREIYQVDPAVLEPTRFVALPTSVPTAREQLDLITRTIESAPSPTAGERAVRLGYRIAESSRSIGGVRHPVIAQVAALVADRARAADDARELFRAANRAGADPLGMLQAWRRELRLSVEAPSLRALNVTEEASIAREAPRVARALEAMGPRLAVGRRGVPRDPAPASVLSPHAGARLLAIADERALPPQAPIAVAVYVVGEQLVRGDEVPPSARAAREDFVNAAFNEERYVAAAAVLRAADPTSIPRLRIIDLQASAFLRSWSQEEPWFPGDAGPSARDLAARFGLDVEFDPSVPEAWRPYAMRTVARALTDLQRVMPTASVRGLTVRFGPVPGKHTILALHDPGTRTLHLPLETSAGTLAHEVAHDLDWQLARQRYGVRGGYATDLAVRAGRGDRIATSLENLSAAFQRPGVDTIIDAHQTRPAEVFARGSDWFIAAALAREGRTGGYLSSYQDPSLTGYGSTRGPDIGGAAVPALLTIYEVIAPVEESVRDWASLELGPSRTLSPTELAVAVLYAGAERPAIDRLHAIIEARDRSLSSVSSETCRFSSTHAMRQLAVLERELVLHSADAATRGAAVDAVRELGDRLLGPGDPRTEEWLAWRMLGAPEPTDSLLVEFAPAFEDVLRSRQFAARSDRIDAWNAFAPAAPVSICGGNPFAAQGARRAPPSFDITILRGFTTETSRP